MDKNLLINLFSLVVVGFVLYRSKDICLNFVKEWKHKKHLQQNILLFKCFSCETILTNFETEQEFDKKVKEYQQYQNTKTKQGD